MIRGWRLIFLIKLREYTHPDFWAKILLIQLKIIIFLISLRMCLRIKRTARFVCVIACAFPDGKIITEKGVIEGHIAHEILGEHGFGYDPIFYVPEYGCTTACLPPEKKK